MAKNNKVSKKKPGKKQESKITTIKLDFKTKERLEHLREHGETYNEIINKALNILNICVKKPLLANKILRDLQRTKKLGSLIENPEKILRKNEESLFEGDLIDNMQRNMQSLRPKPAANQASSVSSANAANNMRVSNNPNKNIIQLNKIRSANPQQKFQPNKMPPKFVPSHQIRQEREDE